MISLGGLEPDEAERSLGAGIPFHHISNADTGDSNPGLNAFVLFVGVSAYR